MKRFLSIVLAFTLVIGCCHVIPTFSTTAQAETTDEEFVLLGNNDALSWQTCSGDLESQTIEFESSIKVKKLRLYVTDLFGSNYIIREFEALDKDGTNVASDGKDDCNVTITSNLTGVDTTQLGYLCNGYGGHLDTTETSWDKFSYTAASTTEYVQFEFAEAVELSAVRIYCSWCNNPSWGNAPEKWKVTGLQEVIMDEDGFTLLGDNSSSVSWADKPSNTFEAQEIVLDEPVWVDKIRLRVTDIYTAYGNNSYRISEFEVFDTNGVNVLASVLTDYKCDESKGQYATNSDGYKRSSLATVVYAEGMPDAKKDTDTTVKYSTPIAGDMIINGENMSNQEHWYDRTGAKEKLATDYIEFQLDRPYEIATVKLWSNWCNGTNAWGCAPKKWQVWGYKTQQKIQNTLDNVAEWENEEFTFQEGKAIPVESGESKAYAGNDKMKEYRAETEVSVESGQMGVYTHVTDEGYYLAVIDKEQNKVLLYKKDTVVAEKYWPISGTVKLAITVNGGKISVWVDEVKMMDYTDPTPLRAGKYGLYAKNASGFFESVSVLPIDVADVLPADYPYEPTAQTITEELTSGDYYVAENGNDANDGKTLETPFKTIQKAQEAVKTAKEVNPNKNYTIILRGGTYYLDNTLTMNSEDGGQGEYRVTYAAYKGETPIISGGKKVTSEWMKCTDEDKQGIYVTRLPDEFENVNIRQLFVDDTRATRSREPDVSDYTETDDTMTKAGYWLLGQVANDRTWISPKATLPETWADLTGVEACIRTNWQYHRQEVTFNTAENKVKVNRGAFGKKDSVVSPSVALKDWVYFENALLFVDTPGEWYYDAATKQLYYYPENGENPNELDIVIPCLDKLIDMTGTQETPVKNISFLGLRFCHTTWEMPEGGRITGQAGDYCTYDSEGNLTNDMTSPVGAVNFKYAERMSFQDCEFTMLGEGAMNLNEGSHSNLIENCIFTDVGAHGIIIDHPGQKPSQASEYYDSPDVPRGNVIRKNYFNHCATTERSSIGIWGTYLNHTLIEGNTIKNMGYTGISVGWNWVNNTYSSHHNEIISNYVSDVMTQFHDGAGIYVLGAQYNNKMLNNYVKDTAGVNIYFDEGTRFTYCDGNYSSDTDIFYHMCSYDELQASYVKDNYVSVEPEDLSVFGRPVGILGDVNYDASVDSRDLVRFKRFKHNSTIKIDRIVADINSDGYLKNSDLDALREILVKPEEIPVVKYASKLGLQLIENDVLESATVTSNITVTESADPKALNDGTTSVGYNSTIGSTVFPEEFTFKWDSAQTGKVLRLTANYTTDQAPTNIEIMLQTETGWKYAAKCNVTWDSSSDDWQYVDIPIEATNITALKLIVKEANFTWNKYAIGEVELLTIDDLVSRVQYSAQKGDTVSDNNLLKTATIADDTLTGDVSCLANGLQHSYDGTTKPEEFVITWETVQEASTLRIFANYATDQAPTTIDIWAQVDGEWKLSSKAKVAWVESNEQYEYVDIPIGANQITGLKVIVQDANWTWNHYMIADMEVLP